MEEIKKFVKKIEKRFNGRATCNRRNYFLGYGIRFGKTSTLNVIMDDRDIERMSKNELIGSIKKILDEINPNHSKIMPNVILLSDLNEKNVWQHLGDYAEIKDIKSLITFFNIKLPIGFQEAFEKLPDKFKLDDLRRELKKTINKEYHRNTYQNWLNFLKKAEYVELKNKTYIKTPRFNRSSVLKSKIERTI